MGLRVNNILNRKNIAAPGNFSLLATNYLFVKVNHKIVGEGPDSAGGDIFGI